MRHQPARAAPARLAGGSERLPESAHMPTLTGSWNFSRFRDAIRLRLLAPTVGHPRNAWRRKKDCWRSARGETMVQLRAERAGSIRKGHGSSTNPPATRAATIRNAATASGLNAADMGPLAIA